MSNIYDVNWPAIVPPSIAGDEQVKAITEAITPQIQEVSNAIKECIILARLDEQPEAVVDLLAWQYHVDFYSGDLPIEQKRDLVRTSIDAHMHKGTPYAVEQVVKAILGEAEVQEWFDYGGEPYHFRVVKIGGQMVDADMYTNLKSAINKVKNTRSWLEGVSLSRTIDSEIFFGVILGGHRKIDIYPSAFKMPDIYSSQYYSSITQTHKNITLEG